MDVQFFWASIFFVIVLGKSHVFQETGKLWALRGFTCVFCRLGDLPGDLRGSSPWVAGSTAMEVVRTPPTRLVLEAT